MFHNAHTGNKGGTCYERTFFLQLHAFALIYSVCFTRSLFRSRLWFIFFLAFSPQNKGHSKSNFYGLCIQILALVLFLYFLVLTLLVGYVKEPSFASYGHFCYTQDPVIHCLSPKYEQLLLFNFRVPFAIAVFSPLKKCEWMTQILILSF